MLLEVERLDSLPEGAPYILLRRVRNVGLGAGIIPDEESGGREFGKTLLLDLELECASDGVGSAARHGPLIVYWRAVTSVAEIYMATKRYVGEILELMVTGVGTVRIWPLIAVSKTWFFVVLSIVLK